LGKKRFEVGFNPLNAELNPICHLLALLGAHHILHVSRIGVCVSSLLRWRKPEEMLLHTYVHSEIGLGISGVAAGDCKMYGNFVVILTL
jgi:hypothetical protein